MCVGPEREGYMAERKIRRSQTVSPFGVGAIFDFGEESFVAQDISLWRGGNKIYLPRLSDRLNINHFRMAPSPASFFSKYTPKIPFIRFPAWLFCPSCRRMVRFRQDDERPNEVPVCSFCGGGKISLTPMRFVLVCENGHMGDVDWKYWAHFGATEQKKKQCQQYKLKFISKGGQGGGLESVEVVCEACGAKNHLGGIVAKDAMKRLGVRCPGKQPWQSVREKEECECVPQVVQRGASNVYFSVTASALDISSSEAVTEVSESKLSIRNHSMFDTLKIMAESQESPFEDSAVNKIAEMVAAQVKCSVDSVLVVLKEDIGDGNEDAGNIKEYHAQDLYCEEWLAFMHPPESSVSDDHFVAETVDLNQLQKSSQIPAGALTAFRQLSHYIDRLVLVRRLREVRCLRGFDRYSPREKDHVRPDLGKGTNWLPAVEVFGEGIFLSLKESELKSWENKYIKTLKDRLEPMVEGRSESGISFLPEVTARFVLLHTLSHLLIRQLSFECGYSASSLRERIYCAPSEDVKGAMAGILIYTADSDSEGSLGGLVHQGEPELFLPTLYRSLHQALWCSGDPVCGEVRNQGFYGMNRGACHSCAIISETSCTCMNVLLDRKILIDETAGSVGFFNPLLDVFSGAFDA